MWPAPPPSLRVHTGMDLDLASRCGRLYRRLTRGGDIHSESSYRAPLRVAVLLSRWELGVNATCWAVMTSSVFPQSLIAHTENAAGTQVMYPGCCEHWTVHSPGNSAPGTGTERTRMQWIEAMR